MTKAALVRLLLDFGGLILVSIGLAVVNFSNGGSESVLQGLEVSKKMSLKFTLLFLLIFFLIGQADVLVKKHLLTIQTYLSGGKGLFRAFFAGALAPGGFMANAPMIQSMWASGVNRQSLLIFLVATQSLNWQIFLIRLPILGWPVMIALWAVNLLTTLTLLGFMLLYLRFH